MGKKNKNSCGDDDHLLPDVDVYFMIQEILLCLPVKSLLRFKSVSKSWRQLIQSSFFINLHTSATFINSSSSSSSSSKFGDTFIVQTTEYSAEKYGDDVIKLCRLSSSESGSNCDHGDCGKYEDDIKLYMRSSSSSSSGSDGDYNGDGEDDEDNEDDEHQKKKMVFKLDDLGFLPFYRDFLLDDSLRMVGSCNGIICLHDPEVMDYHRGGSKQHYSNLRDVCLWNPATRQFRILPKSIPIQEKQEYIDWLEDFIAFGFDVKTKDYKVLRITPFREESEEEEEEGGGGCTCRLQVYSLSTDSWRLLEGINSLPVQPNQKMSLNSGIYLNGSYFFLGNKSNNGVWGHMLMSFDFTKEIFTTMQQLPEDNSYSYGLSYLGEKLVVFTFQINCDSYDYYDIWVLNEQHGSDHGVMNNESSWTKLHSFRIKSSRVPTDVEPSDSSSDTDDTFAELSHTEPRCISNNGEFALISTGITNAGGYSSNKFVLFNLITKETIKDFTIGNWNQCRAEVYKESLVSIMGGGNVLLRWQLPSHGTTYKLNLNAPLFFPKKNTSNSEDYYSFGNGLCLTSDTGGCIGVRSLSAFYARDPEEGEAMAMLEAIKWANKLELSPIIIESDSKNVVSFFMEDDDDNNSIYWSNSKALLLLGEAKLLLNSSELDISFQYCSRSSNYVADIAAKLGREGIWFCMDWTANSPGEIVMSLSEDLGLKTKHSWGLSLM